MKMYSPVYTTDYTYVTSYNPSINVTSPPYVPITAYQQINPQVFTPVVTTPPIVTSNICTYLGYFFAVLIIILLILGLIGLVVLSPFVSSGFLAVSSIEEDSAEFSTTLNCLATNLDEFLTSQCQAQLCAFLPNLCGRPACQGPQSCAM